MSDRTPEWSPELWHRLRRTLNATGVFDAHEDDEGAVRTVVQALMPVIATEVSARVSEAQVAVPPPLTTGYIQRLVDKRHADGWIEVVVTVGGSKEDLRPVLQGQDVALYSADLAEQATKAREENTLLGCRVQDAWKRAEEVEAELEAMTAVARRFAADDFAVEDGDQHWWDSDGENLSDAERDALKRLSEEDDIDG